MTAAADVAPPPAAPPAPPDAPGRWSAVWGLTAVLLGTFLSTLNGRLSTFGLNDIRGAIHAGFDEGAWITTAQTAAQMLVVPLAVWFGGVYGTRKVLLWSALGFAAVSLVKPFAPNLAILLALQFAGGVTSGFFVPLTVGFILRAMPPRLWPYGIAIYALNLEFSLNISASIEGFYADHLSWKWIFWQSVPIALAMAACLHFGARPEPRNPDAKPHDVFGLATGGVGLAVIYAALDQGNRVDWLNSGMIWGLFIAGAISLAAFIIHELRTDHPFMDLKVLTQPPFPSVAVLIGILRLTILSTAYLIPTFLGGVRGFRALEMGPTLLWIAAPQLLVCAFAGVTLRRIDARMSASLGFVLIAAACLMVAHALTPLWGSDQFWPSQLLQAVGQSFALTGIVFYSVQHITPAAALTLGAFSQIARLMGGEIGQAFVVTFVRVRSQIADNLIGLHVVAGDAAVDQRVRALGAATARLGDTAATTTRGAALLSSSVRAAATTQAVIDGYVMIAAFAALGMLLLAAQPAPAPDHPAAPRLMFRKREAAQA
jgi:MFS transporter, DHA2 family, multidrug resistance protein